MAANKPYEVYFNNNYTKGFDNLKDAVNHANGYRLAYWLIEVWSRQDNGRYKITHQWKNGKRIL